MKDYHRLDKLHERGSMATDLKRMSLIEGVGRGDLIIELGFAVDEWASLEQGGFDLSALLG